VWWEGEEGGEDEGLGRREGKEERGHGNLLFCRKPCNGLFMDERGSSIILSLE
jgi:hypothetical protein